ncbi:MAG TPA: PEGA domain-containing protein, partial [Vicinamibacterales bacterium]|nr:PEGA domain-containing protein [Vicinamibacterales bacterium]
RPGYEAQEKRVTLSREEPAVRLTFDLRPLAAAPARQPGEPERAETTPAASGRQTLVVETQPAGARVRVGGRDYGVTPVTITPIRTGLHKIELRLGGYRPWAETITVKAGQVRRVSVPLERTNSR